MLRTKIYPYTLNFKRPAGTSRGVYYTHDVWYIIIYDEENPSYYGIGECAPLFDLSCDYSKDYEESLRSFCRQFELDQCLNNESMRNYPSILFGFETALQHFIEDSFKLWKTPFSEGKIGIPINGLIWMGDYDFMLEQIQSKMEEGFSCIKLKIGAIDFEKEIDLLRQIRRCFSDKDITLRVDANGAFSADEALDKLERLAQLDLHSIEQPIKAGQWEKMSKLTSSTPLPIALDEELIGVNQPDQKRKLLKTIQPQYIILKPTLHGGLSGSQEWIDIANEMNIKWWITSALESNIGLNCIAQWCSTLSNTLPQGLGTGMLYTNNIDMPLEIKNGHLWFNPKGTLPNLSVFE